MTERWKNGTNQTTDGDNKKNWQTQIQLVTDLGDTAKERTT